MALREKNGMDPSAARPKFVVRPPNDDVPTKNGFLMWTSADEDALNLAQMSDKIFVEKTSYEKLGMSTPCSEAKDSAPGYGQIGSHCIVYDTTGAPTRGGKFSMPLCTVGGCASSRFYPYQLCSHHHDLIQRPVQYAKNSSGSRDENKPELSRAIDNVRAPVLIPAMPPLLPFQSRNGSVLNSK